MILSFYVTELTDAILQVHKIGLFGKVQGSSEATRRKPLQILHSRVTISDTSHTIRMYAWYELLLLLEVYKSKGL